MRADTSAVHLASGPPITAHGDLLDSWSQSRLDDELRICIHVKGHLHDRLTPVGRAGG